MNKPQSILFFNGQVTKEEWENLDDAFEAVSQGYFEVYYDLPRSEREDAEIQGFVYDPATKTTHEFVVSFYSYREYAGASLQTEAKEQWFKHAGLTPDQVMDLRLEEEAEHHAQQAKINFLAEARLRQRFTLDELNERANEEAWRELYDPQHGMEDDFR